MICDRNVPYKIITSLLNYTSFKPFSFDLKNKYLWPPWPSSYQDLLNYHFSVASVVVGMNTGLVGLNKGKLSTRSRLLATCHLYYFTNMSYLW